MGKIQPTNTHNSVEIIFLFAFPFYTLLLLLLLELDGNLWLRSVAKFKIFPLCTTAHFQKVEYNAINS